MTHNPLQRLLDVVRRRADPDATGPLADERLLARFVADGDPSAFELLVWRHGGLVYGTCRRVLGNLHASEDAFQATFLALARKPRAVRSGAALAGWLHRVAVRVANKLRASSVRQSAVERAAARSLAMPPQDAGAGEITAVVDEEIDRLPARLRRTVVLCYLEGRSTEQAAQLLDCPRGTVLSRLAAARERLRGRLTRRGFTLPTTGISLLLLSSDSPAALVPAAVRAALSGASPVLIGLVQGVFHAMFITKVKLATAVVLTVGLAGAGVGWVTVPGSGPAVVQADEPKKADKPVAVQVPTQQDKRDFANEMDRTLDLILEARRTIRDKLEQAEQAHQEFRLKNPIVFFKEANPRSRIEPIEKKLSELRLKKTETETRLSFLKEEIAGARDKEAREMAAAGALSKLQMRGVDVRVLREGVNPRLITEAEGLNSTVVRSYIEALQSEIRDIDRTTSALGELKAGEEKMLRELTHFELMEERLRNNIIQNRVLFDSIVKRLQEINLRKDQYLK